MDIARIDGLHGFVELVDGLQEGFQLRQRFGHNHGRMLAFRPEHGADLLLPLLLDLLHLRLHFGRGRQKQRARRVARFQPVDGVVKLLDFSVDFGGVVPCVVAQEAQTVALHAQAAHIVNRCRAAFKLPGKYQGQADGKRGGHQPDECEGL